MRPEFIKGLLFSVLLAPSLMAQHLPIDPETNKITFMADVQLDTNISSSSIEDACQAWVTSYYKNDAQLESNSKMKGQLFKIANFPVYRRRYGRGGVDVNGGFIQYTVTFTVLEKGRYIIAVSGFIHTDPATGRNFGAPEEFYAMSSKDTAIMKYYIDQIDAFSRELLELVETYVEGSAR